MNNAIDTYALNIALQVSIPYHEVKLEIYSESNLTNWFRMVKSTKVNISKILTNLPQ